MRTLVKPLTAAATAAALALAAATSPAYAGGAQPHTLTITLQDGRVATIAYTGNVPPQVVLAPMPAFPMPETFPGFALPPAFAELQQAAEAMQLKTDAMLRQAESLTQASTGSLPQGAQIFTAETTITSNGACTRSTQITYSGNGLAPRQVSSLSGSCARAPQRLTAPSPAQPHQPRLIEARAQPGYRSLVKPATWQTASTDQP